MGMHNPRKGACCNTKNVLVCQTCGCCGRCGNHEMCDNPNTWMFNKQKRIIHSLGTKLIKSLERMKNEPVS